MIIRIKQVKVSSSLVSNKKKMTEEKFWMEGIKCPHSTLAMLQHLTMVITSQFQTESSLSLTHLLLLKF